VFAEKDGMGTAPAVGSIRVVGKIWRGMILVSGSEVGRGLQIYRQF